MSGSEIVPAGRRSALAEEIVAEQARLAGRRGTWEDHWQQVADRVWPTMGAFNAVRADGGRRTEKMFDSTAALALENWTAAIVGMVAPRDQHWHGLRAGQPELDRLPAVQRFFEQLRDRLFWLRYSPRANFANQFHETVKGMGAFGTGPIWIDDEPGYGAVYRTVHLAEIYLEEDHHGRAATIYRRSRLTARQWQRRWGDHRLPPSVRDALASGQAAREFEFVHCIRPREGWDPDAPGVRGMPLESLVASVTDRTLVSARGFRAMPLVVGRLATAPREVYGRSPAMMALPDIKMVNEMVRTLLRAAHRAVAPPLLTHDDGVLTRLSLKPDAVNIGGLDFQGRPLVRPLDMGGNIPEGMAVVEAARKAIERAFLVPLFDVLTETPDRMTATEVLQRAREKGILLAPVASKIEGELLGPMIDREIDILAANGWLPPVPPELAEAGGEYRVTYENPLSRAARSERSIGIMRFIEATAPIAQVAPEVWQVVDWAQWARWLAEDNAIPASGLRDPDAVQAERQTQADVADATMALQGAELAGRAALSLARAQEAGGLGGALVA